VRRPDFLHNLAWFLTCHLARLRSPSNSHPKHGQTATSIPNVFPNHKDKITKLKSRGKINIKVWHLNIILIQKNYVNIIYFVIIWHKYFKHGLYFCIIFLNKMNGRILNLKSKSDLFCGTNGVTYTLSYRKRTKERIPRWLWPSHQSIYVAYLIIASS
jgi:hypothetical protein